MKKIKLFITSILLLYSSLIFSQGMLDGFMKGKGKTDVALSYSYEKGKKFYGRDGLRTLGRDIQSINLFVAHGITNYLDVLASVPYISNGGQESAFQDASIFLRAKLLEVSILDVKTRFMIGAGYMFPLSDYKTESANSIGQQAESKEVRAMVQFEKNAYFLLLKGGYSFRNNPNTDALQFVGKLGIAKEKYYADLFVEYLKPDGGSDYPLINEDSASTFRELGVGFLRIGVNGYKPLSNHLGIVGGLAYTLDGRNIGKTTRFTIGLVAKF